MQIKKQLAQLTPYQPGKPIEEVKREFNLKTVVKLASNENPFGYSESAKVALQSEILQMPLYPDGSSHSLRTKLAKHLGVNEMKIIFGNGADEVIQIISRSMLNSHSNTVMASPTFSQYKHNAVIEGAEVREINLLENGCHDLDLMLDAIDQQTKIVWVCSPNNPTGSYEPEQKLLRFLDQVPKHVLVVIDEAYYEYVTAEDYPKTIALLDRYPNLMILRTFSKAYGLAALRIGYGIASEQLIQAIEPVRQPFNINRLAQAAALGALDDQTFIKDCVRKNREGLQQYYDFCSTHGLKYYPSQTNFVLIDFNRDADVLFEELLRQGYIVRSGKALGFPTSLRISVGSKEQNEGFLNTLIRML
ncbi:histidinol-phosphate transaminase [Bacillus changyiensis]|uniref:histidinol-phosphate transaminase n=1 Tax=Bacillus changyiensis TaxID=3004103 RepID=UPI0022E0B96E|nr:histidinol-phosphate transaminase [Bacillus changyiensis]MDA1475311.1 histidinol-phosphate transaminase [Bacillus changyiensis]